MTRLSQLNRQVSPEHRDPALTASPDTAERLGLQVPGQCSTEDVSQLPDGQEVTNQWGTHWQRGRALADFWSHGDYWLSCSTIRADACVALPRSRELRALLTHLPDRVLYLDLETCGFAGSMVFLVGLLHRSGKQFQLTQLLARNYAEEKAMLQTLWSIAAENCVLATYNGKSFDWPMVHDRSTVHHLGRDMRPTKPEQPGNGAATVTDPIAFLSRDDPRPELVHCDLLHHARRRWKGKLPDCKLQTLERYVCRRNRSDDIPGREIPAAYHDFVRSGDAFLMRSVLHHNALDLITLLQLSILLLSK